MNASFATLYEQHLFATVFVIIELFLMGKRKLYASFFSRYNPAMAKKYNANKLIHDQGLAHDPEEAKRLVMAGIVYYLKGGHWLRVDKPGQQFTAETTFAVHRQDKFVSRGAYKLLTALNHFKLDVHGRTALDAGASTGGFTDCLLQHGARKVYAVDVGKNQLHERLRADPRVVSLEGVNLRLAPSELLPELVDMIVADVSFISLTEVLPSCVRWLIPGGLVAALIKPQFEVPVGQTEKGVVRDEAVREKAVERVLEFVRNVLELELLGVVPSAIKGPKGNQEFMAVWRAPDS